MKLEIKLNQEQFDLLVTYLIQIAQNSVKMAEAIEKTGAKMIKKYHTTYVLHEDAQKVIDWINKHRED